MTFAEFHSWHARPNSSISQVAKDGSPLRETEHAGDGDGRPLRSTPVINCPFSARTQIRISLHLHRRRLFSDEGAIMSVRKICLRKKTPAPQRGPPPIEDALYRV